MASLLARSRIKRHELSTYTVLGVGKGLRTSIAEVSIERPTPEPTPLTVALRCVSVVVCSVQPASITFAAFGMGARNFTIEGLEIGSTLLEVTGNGFTITYPVTVYPLDAILFLGPVPQSVAVGSDRTGVFVAPIARTNAVFVQDAVLPIEFDLRSDPPGILSISPLRVTVPAGTFRSQDVTLTGVSPGAATLTISNPQMPVSRVQGFTVTP